ncbi:phage baseplate assembly protein V [Musicola paradisiaca]|uniref:Phage baseplate assembly protein V n=1 Tax=Musicola paradisiaca (strain Ech703) TaxID=579405 RepID=C6C6Y3_MUSP7|nr:phage baseplate assembly protein V [Musicola paradisiaca]ACS85877.1 phage baseplate assembly protein V [Musicola paradisiaca Ech703]
MNTYDYLSEIQRTLRNLIRIGVVTDVDTQQARCRVQTGGITTGWLNWLSRRAGSSREWWAPSTGEQVLLLAIGGELNTAFVLPGIYSNQHPAPSTSADACHIQFPDGAVMEYEPATGALIVAGIKTASVTAAESVVVTTKNVTVNAIERITLATPEVVCTHKLITQTLEVQQGGSITGNMTHSGGSLTSNGIVAHTHQHSGVQSGGGTTGGPL